MQSPDFTDLLLSISCPALPQLAAVHCWWQLVREWGGMLRGHCGVMVSLVPLFIYLAKSGLSCSTQGLHCVLWDLSSWCTDSLVSCSTACGILVPWVSTTNWLMPRWLPMTEQQGHSPWPSETKPRTVALQHPLREFRGVHGVRHSVLQAISWDSSLDRHFRNRFYDPDPCISSYLEKH